MIQRIKNFRGLKACIERNDNKSGVEAGENSDDNVDCIRAVNGHAITRNQTVGEKSARQIHRGGVQLEIGQGAIVSD
jgi:hypothetical protein